MEEESYDIIYKLLIIGDAGVGKTGIMNRYIYNNFNSQSKPTMGVEFGTKKTKINNTIIRAQIWDTAGQEKYRSITSAYYRGAKAAIVVYDVTNKDSFNNIEKWINEIKATGDKDMIIVICGNKIDLDEQRIVSMEEAKEKAANNKLILIETSAKTNENIDKVFDNISNFIYNDYIDNKDINIDKEDIIDVTHIDIIEKDKKKCC